MSEEQFKLLLRYIDLRVKELLEEDHNRSSTIEYLNRYDAECDLKKSLVTGVLDKMTLTETGEIIIDAIIQPKDVVIV